MSALPEGLIQALDVAAATDRLLVASDFDGTLAPIVDHPADARALPATAAALAALAELPATSAVLVSGRALATLRDLASASGVPDTVSLVGSHGVEFDAGGFTHDVDEALLARIIEELEAIAAQRPGVTVETKPAGVALHVRNARAADGEAALDAARGAAESWDVHATEGKAVLEFAVVATDKGEAVDVLRTRGAATAVVYLGDDVTDENAFRRLRDGDVGVKVGSGDTLAAHRVDAPADVATVLEHLLARRR